MSDPNPGAPDAPTPPPARRWARRFVVALALVVALVAIAWLAVPPIVRSQLESRLTGTLGRPTRVETVAFNPFRLELELRKLTIAGREAGPPFVAVDGIVADLSAASIWHRAPVLDALRIVRPSIALARDAEGRWSFDDIADRLASAPPGPPPRFSLNNIEIDGGSVTFDDRAAGRRHALTALDVGIPFLSSLPYQTDVRVTPRASGVVNGARFALGGSTVPFAERREASLDIDIDALPLPEYVAYLPSKPRFTLAGGALTTRLKLVFVDGKPAERKLELRGEARVDALAVRRADGSPVLGAERIAVVLDRVDVFGRDARLASVAIDAPQADVRRAADGSLELARPFETSAATAPAATAAREAAWTVRVARATIARGALSLADAGSGFRTSLSDVAVDATSLSTLAGERAKLEVSFVSSDRIASFTGEADADLAGRSADGRFALTRFSLGLLFPYYKDALAVDVQKGSLDYASAFSLGADGRLALSQGEAAITDLRLAFPGAREPLWRVPRLAARGIDVDVPARKVAIGEMESRGAALKVVRDRDGTLEVARFVRTTAATGVPAANATGATNAAAASVAARDDATWQYAIRKLSIDRVAIDGEDRVPDPPAKFALKDLSVAATDIGNARGSRATVTLRTGVGERGRLVYTGAVGTNPFALDGRLDATSIAIAIAKPYVEPRVNVVLTGGTLDAKGRVTLTPVDGAAPRATWNGGIAVRDFAMLDRPSSSDLARWKLLALDDVDVVSAPLAVAIGRIGLEDFAARAIVYSDGTLNLARLLTPGAEPVPAPDARPAPATDAPPAREALPIAIGRIELLRGAVNFSDLFVRPNYSANLTDVAGTISTLKAGDSGDVAVVARIERTAPVEIQGRIAPFGTALALDISAKAADVDLPPLTPYSAKYAGYGIERGKLSFDVRYRIDDRKLAAENRLVLDQLTFGPRVDSPDATKLPVLLAVALLKDAKGVIDVRLPISGSLDDPQFSVFGLVVQVIVNLIAKAATAPFALLSAAFGGGEELSTLPFTAGSSALAGEAVARIDTLAKALADRPGLKLDIGGRADPAADRAALRRAAAETMLKREKLKSLAGSGSAPASVDAVTIGADERARWLTAAYRAAPIAERPRNALGMLREVPPAEMDAMLLASAKVDDEALALLANARAQAVKDALAAKGIAGERLFLTAPKLGTEGEKAAAAPGPTEAKAATSPPARVDLALR